MRRAQQGQGHVDPTSPAARITPVKRWIRRIALALTSFVLAVAALEFCLAYFDVVPRARTRVGQFQSRKSANFVPSTSVTSASAEPMLGGATRTARSMSSAPAQVGSGADPSAGKSAAP